jgi:tetratricopeptide (TPR) repeat protein
MTHASRFLAAALCSSLLLAACSRHDEAAATRAAPASSLSAEPAARATPTPAPTSNQATPGAALANAPAPGDYLSSAWALAHKQSDPAVLAESARLEALGHELYRKHQDADALVQYERALDAAATGSAYYKYGNSLSNVNRLDDTIKAYAIAIELGYEHPEAVHYNTACALSRKGDFQRAHDELRSAVAAGYASERKILNDPDLANLRAQPDWAARWAALRPTLEALIGEYRVYGDRDDHDFYTFCPDSQVVTSTNESVDGSCCQSHLYGTLQKQGSDFTVDWYVKCGKQGQGKKESTANWPYVPCQPYKSCSKEVTCKPRKPAKPDKLFDEKELAAQTLSAFPEDYQSGDKGYVPASAPANECAQVAEVASRYRPQAARR